MTLPAHRAVHIRGRLDGLDHGAGLARAQLAARLRDLDEHQIAERALRMFGYAYSTAPSSTRRTHSWLLVYRKSSGMSLKVNPPWLVKSRPFPVAHERRLDDARRVQLAANLDHPPPGPRSAARAPAQWSGSGSGKKSPLGDFAGGQGKTPPSPPSDGCAARRDPRATSPRVADRRRRADSGAPAGRESRGRRDRRPTVQARPDSRG